MPEMDGYEFMNKIKQDKTLSQIPVIILTENQTETLKRRCLKAVRGTLFQSLMTLRS